MFDFDEEAANYGLGKSSFCPNHGLELERFSMCL